VTHEKDIAAKAHRVLSILDGQIASDTTNGSRPV
jgi:ABC-type lipoprotein export system ATPase subunit